LSPEATIANAIEGTSDDNEREDVVTSSKFDDGISEEIILEESTERSDEYIRLSYKDRLEKTIKLLTVFLNQWLIKKPLKGNRILVLSFNSVLTYAEEDCLSKLLSDE
jgi:hypothetical protein